MKMRPVSVCLALAVSVTLVVVACTVAQKHGPGVYIHEASVEIYPGTNISSADQKALDAVLKKFDKSFYKIRTYDRGKLVKTHGSLEEARIDQTLVADAIKASQKGVSVFTLQLGIGIGKPNWTAWMIHPMWSSPSPSPVGQTDQSYTPIHPMYDKDYQVSKRLVSLVTPILQKYSYDQPATVKNVGQ